MNKNDFLPHMPAIAARKHGNALLLSTAAIALFTGAAFSEPVNGPIAPIYVNGIDAGVHNDFSITTGSGVHAVHARNPGATVTLQNGDITTTTLTNPAPRTYGILSQSGASVTTDNVNITSTGPSGHAVQAGGRGTGGATSIYDGSTAGAVTLNGGAISTNGRYSVGLHAVDGGFINATGVSIDTKGIESPAIHAESNSTVAISGSTIQTNAALSAGVVANNDRKPFDNAAVGGQVTITDTSITTTGYDSHGVVATNGASIAVNNGAVETHGTNSIGLLAHTGGEISSNANVTTAANGSHAVQAGLNNSSNTATPYDLTTAGAITLFGGNLTTSGSNASAINATDGSLVNASNVTAATSGLMSHGVDAQSATAINISDSTVTTSGAAAVGLRASNDRASHDAGVIGGVLNAANVDVTTNGASANALQSSNGATLTYNGGNIRTYGDAAAAIEATDGTVTATANVNTHGLGASGVRATNATVTLNGGSVTTASDYAQAISALDSVVSSSADLSTSGVMSYGATSSGASRLSLNGGSVTTTGTNAFGIGAYVGGAIESSAVINTSGMSAHGIYATHDGNVIQHGGSVTATGANAAGAFIEGSTLRAADTSITSAQDVAIKMTGNSTVVLNNTVVTGNTATIAAGFTAADQIGRVTVGAGSVLTSTDNVLLYVDRSTPNHGATGAVELTLQNGSISRGDIVDDGVRTTGYTDVDVGASAVWEGRAYGVRNLRMAAPGANMSFDAGTDIAGSIATNQSTLTFAQAGATIGGNVDLTNGSVSSGGSVMAPIYVGGALFVDPTSRMGGNWSIAGDLTSAGSITPGNSIGVVNVGGNLNLIPGSTYHVEVNAAGESDRINVAGVANLAGHVGVSTYPAVNDYKVDAPYTIVTAGGGFAGSRFDGASWIDGTHYIFLDPQLSYDPNNVYLTIKRTDVKMEEVTNTPNQASTANAVEGLVNKSPLFMGVATLTSEADARNAFNQLSGEAHASVAGALIEDSRFIRDAVTTRLRQANGNTTAGAANTTQNVNGLNATFWGQAFGGWGHSKGTANYTIGTASRSTAGFFVGVDAPVMDDWRVGVAAGYSRSNIDVKSRTSNATVDSYHVALYGGRKFGDFGVNLGAAYSWHDINLSRNVAFPGFNDATRASYKAATAQAFGEINYTLARGNTTIEPYLAFAWVNLNNNRFNEVGGVAALTGKTKDMNTFFTTVGARFAHTFKLDSGHELIARGGVGYRHAFGDVDPRSVMLFDGGSTPFSVAGAPIARSSVVVEAGLDMKVARNVAIGISYQGQLARKVQDHAIKAHLTINF